jgi:fused signal recognition particle receptor
LFESLKKAFASVTQAVSSRDLSREEIERTLSALQTQLVQADVPLESAVQICSSIRGELELLRVKRLERSDATVNAAVKMVLMRLLEVTKAPDFVSLVNSKIRERGICVLVFFGVNGSGKTTTIAKVGSLLKDRGFLPIFAAADTFRAGAIEQLKEHAERLQIPLGQTSYGRDPASVGYTAIQEAKNKGRNVVLIDTAGRMQNDVGLVDQMDKIVRVTKPDYRLFIADSLVGNDSLNQLITFNQRIGIDGVILTKLDADARGGVILAIAMSVKKPIVLVGTGQSYRDLQSFTPDFFLSKLF